MYNDKDKHNEMEIYFVSPIPCPYSKILFYPISIPIRRLLSLSDSILSYPSKSKDEWYHHFVKKGYSIFIKDRERYLTIEKDR